MQGGQIQGRPVSFGEDIYLPSYVICGCDLRDCDLRGCVRNDRPCYGRDLRGSRFSHDCVRRERRGRLPSDHAGFQIQTCSASLAKRERLVS